MLELEALEAEANSSIDLKEFIRRRVDLWIKFSGQAAPDDAEIFPADSPRPTMITKKGCSDRNQDVHRGGRKLHFFIIGRLRRQQRLRKRSGKGFQAHDFVSRRYVLRAFAG